MSEIREDLSAVEHMRESLESISAAMVKLGTRAESRGRALDQLGNEANAEAEYHVKDKANQAAVTLGHVLISCTELSERLQAIGR